MLSLLLISSGFGFHFSFWGAVFSFCPYFLSSVINCEVWGRQRQDEKESILPGLKFSFFAMFAPWHFSLHFPVILPSFIKNNPTVEIHCHTDFWEEVFRRRMASLGTCASGWVTKVLYALCLYTTTRLLKASWERSAHISPLGKEDDGRSDLLKPQVVCQTFTFQNNFLFNCGWYSDTVKIYSPQFLFLMKFQIYTLKWFSDIKKSLSL